MSGRFLYLDQERLIFIEYNGIKKSAVLNKRENKKMRKDLTTFLKIFIVSIVSIVIGFLPMWWISSLLGVIKSLAAHFSNASSLGYRIDFSVHFFLLGIAGFLQITFISILWWWLVFLWTDKFPFELSKKWKKVRG